MSHQSTAHSCGRGLSAHQTTYRTRTFGRQFARPRATGVCVSGYICIYMYVYVGMYICKWIYVYPYIYASIHTFCKQILRTNAHAVRGTPVGNSLDSAPQECLCESIYAYESMCICMYTNVYININLSICRNIYQYMSTFIHVYIYVYVKVNSARQSTYWTNGRHFSRRCATGV